MPTKVHMVTIYDASNFDCMLERKVFNSAKDATEWRKVAVMRNQLNLEPLFKSSIYGDIEELDLY